MKMSIKKLIHSNSEKIKINLSPDEAVLTFSLKTECYFLTIRDLSEEDLYKLKDYQAATEVKFVGGEGVFSKLSDIWNYFTRVIFIERPVEIFYNPLVRKMQFNPDQTGLIKKKNILIVDDSKTIQKLLVKILAKSKILNIIGIAGSAEEAQVVVEKGNVDLITLDIHMPGMNGVEFLKSYLVHKKIPTVMISSVSLNEGPLVMEALSHGASTYIQKPDLNDLSTAATDIIEKLEALSQIGTKEFSVLNKKTSYQFETFEGLIAIGSSTGGTQALQQIFTSLPDTIPPIVVVQHIPAVFSRALAERLNSLCNFNVKEAEHDEILSKNTIYIAPGGKQMKIKRDNNKLHVVITDDPPLNRFQPSVDYLFNSLPELKITNLLGIILTGMGKDGAKGLLNLKNNGAYTIAQDEASSIVFGMPKEAIALNAHLRIVSLNEMANQIVLNFNKVKSKNAA
jgi:two-component system, chemotaxis family, protein-glutamate methylesterase/glutaminase